VREMYGLAGVAQLVERKPSKLDVAGSSPVSRLPDCSSVRAMGWSGKADGMAGERPPRGAAAFGVSRDIARVAQLVEHTLGKGEVTGSIPVASLMAVRGARVVIWDHRW
jgi:hypothetical protein